MVFRFALRCFLLALPAAAMVVAYAMLYKPYFPAPKVTNNIALNEKLAFAKRNMPEGVDVLGLGSSMSLNNLNSKAVMEHFGAVRYLNAGAWGVGAAELSEVGPLLVDRLKPRIVLLSTNLMDFKRGGHTMVLGEDSSAMASYMSAHNEALSYVLHWDMSYYLRQMEANKVRFTDAANYEFLAFDAHGGASLNVPPERISRSRFELPPPIESELDEDRYAAFAEFARYLHQHEVQMILMECAYLDGMRTAEHNALQAKHLARLRAVLEPLGHRIVDANQGSWPDALFVDSSHLREKGAEAMTRFCLAQLNAKP
ncbi:MAG: hypothetical protein IPH53_10765 [Flavobacteriales bacterium]|jgi:hypothetical protein|nr:hypothetical protein [Flavobacteriales bacterium]MBK7085110.1 hypothetical protein [Flavobacteriales bacterium]MBK7269811.1 hypothetical protein [Flavobacteriales bacterium]MBK7752656.1 hypothetical protein [Flavobacteriales bacterium]MBK9076674.1 hypothetical protein [Flavobacteriales bacterium]